MLYVDVEAEVVVVVEEEEEEEDDEDEDEEVVVEEDVWRDGFFLRWVWGWEEADTECNLDEKW